MKALKDATGNRWMVTLSSSSGAPTLKESEMAAQEKFMAEIRQRPLVRQVFDIFPDATLKQIHKNNRKFKNEYSKNDATGESHARQDANP